MLTKLFSAKHTTKKTRRNAIQRRMFRPEQLEDRRLLAASATFMGLGDLPGGDNYSVALGISDDGQTVVGMSVRDTGTSEPFKWNVGDGMKALPLLPGADIHSARAASADGSVIVGRAGSESALWQNGTAETIASPTTKGSRGSYDVSDNGQVIVGANDNGAYRWEGDVTLPLGNLGGALSSVAYAVSGDGAYVVGQGTTAEGITEPFRWHADTGLVSLGFVGFARDVSADGSVVTGRAFEEVPLKGKRTTTVSEPFRWTEAGKQTLGDLPGGDHSGIGYAISADGSIIAGQSSSSNGTEAFVWDSDAGMRSLNEILTTDYGVDLGGWQLTNVWDMTPDGSALVGQGINPAGNIEAFIASFGPSTPTFSVNDVEIKEGDAGTVVAQFTVSRSGDSSSAVSVDVSTSDGTATVADNDYVAVSGSTLHFDAGVTEMTFDVTVNGDLSEELDETFFIQLANPSDEATVSDGQGVGKIIDDDTNYAPIAVNDDVTVEQDVPAVIDVLANDSDPDGDPLSFASVPDFSANGGSVTVNADNTLTYTPPDTFVETDTFTYTITDGQSTSTATVSITVTDTASMYVADIALIEQARGKNGTDYLISVLVHDVQSQNPLPGVQVTVFIDGKTYTGTTDSEGLFITETLKGIKSGTYSAQVDLALSGYDYELAPSLNSSLYEDDSDGDGLADAELMIF